METTDSSPDNYRLEGELMAREIEARLEKAEGLLNDGHFAEARGILVEMWHRIPVSESRLRLDYLGKLVAACGPFGDFSRALAASIEGLDLSRELEDEEEEIAFGKFAGNCCMMLAATEQALRYFNEAYVKARKAGSSMQQASILNNIGALYVELEEYDESIKFYQASYDLHRANDDKYGMTMAQTNLVSGMSRKRDVAGMETGLDILGKLVEELELPKFKANYLTGRGELEALKGNFKQAEKFLRQGLRIIQEQREHSTLAETYYEMAKILGEQNPRGTEDTLHLFEQALHWAKELGKEQAQVRICRDYSVFLEKQGRHEKALRHLREAWDIDTRLRAQQNSGQLQTLRILNETERIQHETEMERLKNQELAKVIDDLEIARERAEEANRFKSEMLRMAAHDLRNPLGAILGFLEIYFEEPDQQEREQYIRDVILATTETLRILERLLDTSALEEGAIQLHWESLDLGEVAAAVVNRYRQQAQAKGQEVLLEMADEPLPIKADPERLSQILSNLVSNAVKYSPLSSRIDIRVVRDGEDALCAIIDQGPGMTPADIAKLFRPFSRLKNSKPTGGERTTGLGLYLARQLAELQHGTLEAHSEGIGKGCVFTVRFPLGESGEETEA